MYEFFDWFEHEYPYTNFHELNLDWCINTVKLLTKTMKEFVTLNTIKYADPIQWNITKQYEKNTVVVEPLSGTAYISTQAVPSGVGINNTDYWNVVFTLDVISANKNITLRDDANNMMATFESVTGDWLLWNGTLYKVTRTIEIGNAYVDDYNITRYTVEMFVKQYVSDILTTVNTTIGALANLNTSDKTSIVNAINEVLGALGSVALTIGDLDDLNTTDKTDIVSAINEVVSNLSTLSGTVSQHTTDIGNLNTSVTNNSKALSLINNRRFIVMGDSFLAGTNVDGVNPLTSWGALVKSWLGFTDDNFIMIPLGGGGFVSIDASHTFINMLQNTVIADENTITDIVITGGTNDANNTSISNVENAIASFITYAKTRFPNAKIHIGYLGQIRSTWAKVVDNQNMVTAYKKCSKYGATFIENTQYTTRRLTYLQSDLVHPNQDGQNYIAECFANWFLNGVYTVFSEDIGYVGTLGDDVSSGLVTIRQSQNNSQITIEILGTQPLTSNKGSTTLNGTNAYDISNIAGEGFCLGYDIDTGYSTASADVSFEFHDGTRWRNGHGTLQIRGGHLLLYPAVMDEANNNWFTVTIGSIWLPKATTIVFDAMRV